MLNVDKLQDRAQKFLQMAGHPSTGEHEAVSAARALRRMAEGSGVTLADLRFAPPTWPKNADPFMRNRIRNLEHEAEAATEKMGLQGRVIEILTAKNDDLQQKIDTQSERIKSLTVRNSELQKQLEVAASALKSQQAVDLLPSVASLDEEIDAAEVEVEPALIDYKAEEAQTEEYPLKNYPFSRFEALATQIFGTGKGWKRRCSIALGLSLNSVSTMTVRGVASGRMMRRLAALVAAERELSSEDEASEGHMSDPEGQVAGDSCVSAEDMVEKPTKPSTVAADVRPYADFEVAVKRCLGDRFGWQGTCMRRLGMSRTRIYNWRTLGYVPASVMDKVLSWEIPASKDATASEAETSHGEGETSTGARPKFMWPRDMIWRLADMFCDPDEDYTVPEMTALLNSEFGTNLNSRAVSNMKYRILTGVVVLE